MVVIFEETHSVSHHTKPSTHPIPPHPPLPFQTAISSSLVRNSKGCCEKLALLQSLHICFSDWFPGMWGEGENERVGRQRGREGEEQAEGGNREVRGCAMPGSHTVTMTTDITSQEQHLGCLCGLKWHSWRLALASCGCHNVPILSWFAFLCYFLHSTAKKHSVARTSYLLGVLSDLYFACVKAGPASLT